MHQTRAAIARQLSSHQGEAVQVVKADVAQGHRIRGLAVCPGRVMSFVLDACTGSVHTRNLLELSSLTRDLA